MAGLTAGSLAAGTIEFETTALGGNIYSYNYLVSGISFQPNEQLDIRFDPSAYGALSNGVAPAGFSVTLLNPNNPPGDPGDYSALAVINNPSVAGSFSVQFAYLGTGLPAAQPFFLNQYNSDGFFQDTISAGYTTAAVSQADNSPVPEPSTVTLMGFAIVLGGFRRLSRRRREGTEF